MRDFKLFFNLKKPLSVKQHMFKVPQLLDDVAEILMSDIGKKNLTIQTHLDDNCKVMVRADSNIIKQIYFNVLQNAIQNSYFGHIIKVKVQLIERPDKPVYLRFEVVDFGKGIQVSKGRHLKKLFLPAYQREEDFRELIQGERRGFGLAVCSYICQQMNGKISIYPSNPIAGN